VDTGLNLQGVKSVWSLDGYDEVSTVQFRSV
jgi:hypothetical protein